jgi:hypothetical protein
LTSNEGAVLGGASPICLGTSTGTMTLSGYTGTIVRWQYQFNGGVWTDITPFNTTTTYTTVPASAGIWQYRVMVHNTGDLPSAPATIDVSPTTIGGTVTGGATICSGSTSGLLSL